MLAAYLYVYRCLRHNDCSWSYSATGLEYQFLAGPAFTLIFTTCALPMGFIATFAFVPRKIVLSVLVVLWSSMALAAGFAKAAYRDTDLCTQLARIFT